VRYGTMSQGRRGLSISLYYFASSLLDLDWIVYDQLEKRHLDVPACILVHIL